jgi:phosphoheptose isomerase
MKSKIMTINQTQWQAEIRRHLLNSADVKRQAAETCTDAIVKAAEIMTMCIANGGKILLCGNGGSAADCQHIAAEFVSVLRQDFMRPGIAAIALTTDSSFITASANDFGYEGIFKRQTEALGRKGDVLVGISTSGNSKNVVLAVERAKERGLATIALTGGKPSRLSELADVTLQVPSTIVQHIQELHIAFGHILCALVEESLYAKD